MCCPPSYVPRVSPLRREEPGTIYHVCDVKGTHDLITQGWTKLGAHTCSTQAFLRLLQSSFQCYLRLFQCYRVVHEELVDFRGCGDNSMTLDYNTTNHNIFCYSVDHVPCLMLWESTTQRNGQRATSCKFNCALHSNRKYNRHSRGHLTVCACWMALLQVFRPETNRLRHKKYIAYRFIE